MDRGNSFSTNIPDHYHPNTASWTGSNYQAAGLSQQAASARSGRHWSTEDVHRQRTAPGTQQGYRNTFDDPSRMYNTGTQLSPANPSFSSANLPLAYGNSLEVSPSNYSQERHSDHSQEDLEALEALVLPEFEFTYHSDTKSDTQSNNPKKGTRKRPGRKAVPIPAIHEENPADHRRLQIRQAQRNFRKRKEELTEKLISLVDDALNRVKYLETRCDESQVSYLPWDSRPDMFEIIERSKGIRGKKAQEKPSEVGIP